MSVRTATRPAPPTTALLTDTSMPAVRFLTGSGADDVLRPPIEAAGGKLLSATPRHVQYRPGSDLVVKYAAEIQWPGASPKKETILAGTKREGMHEGAVPVAGVVAGQRVEVGVWRWPFDPVLRGLEMAVTPRHVAELCGVADPTTIDVTVVAFRPTDRAVVRVVTPTEVLYLKVVRPPDVAALVAGHRAAAEAGVPVPVVRRTFDELGIVVLEELAGPLLKEHLKTGRGVWPSASTFNRLLDQFATIAPNGHVVPSRVDHAVLHAAMLRSVEGDHIAALDELHDSFASFDSDVEPQIIHGDLHEGQIIVEDQRIVGVLDIDGLGLGSPLEERANLIGFLRYRALTLPSHRARLSAYADELRRGSPRRFTRRELDVATAAVLVGLATGPFRIQQPGWRQTVTQIVDTAAAIAGPSRLDPKPVNPKPVNPNSGLSSARRHHPTTPLEES